jgi:hypothetical protein
MQKRASMAEKCEADALLHTLCGMVDNNGNIRKGPVSPSRIPARILRDHLYADPFRSSDHPIITAMGANGIYASWNLSGNSSVTIYSVQADRPLTEATSDLAL